MPAVVAGSVRWRLSQGGCTRPRRASVEIVAVVAGGIAVAVAAVVVIVVAIGVVAHVVVVVGIAAGIVVVVGIAGDVVAMVVAVVGAVVAVGVVGGVVVVVVVAVLVAVVGVVVVAAVAFVATVAVVVVLWAISIHCPSADSTVVVVAGWSLVWRGGCEGLRPVWVCGEAFAKEDSRPLVSPIAQTCHVTTIFLLPTPRGAFLAVLFVLPAHSGHRASRNFLLWAPTWGWPASPLPFRDQTRGRQAAAARWARRLHRPSLLSLDVSSVLAFV